MFQMASLAVKTLVADRGKLITALVGVVFCVVLVNIQGGLFHGLIGKAGLLVDHGQADIWVGHRKMHNVDFPRDIPRRWLHRVQSVPGVAAAEPYLIGWADMTLPSGGFEAVVVIGVDRSSLLGNAWNLTQGQPESILQPDGIILDECDADKLEHPQMGEVREIGGQRAKVVGVSHGITGFLVAPYVFTTYERAAKYLGKPLDKCSYCLVKVDEGADAELVCEAIRQRIPEVEAFPQAVFSRISADFWMMRTGIGISFGLAALLGVIVGLVMVAQTLYALVLDRLGEFGTLKAIGATEAQIFSVLMVQSLTLAVAGSAIGLALSLVIQHTQSTPRAEILIPTWLLGGSVALVIAICLISSLLPYLRVRKVDPMIVLQ